MIKVHGKPVYVETALFKDVLNELRDIKGNRLTYPISKEEGKKRDILIGKYLEENYPSKSTFSSWIKIKRKMKLKTFCIHAKNVLNE